MAGSLYRIVVRQRTVCEAGHFKQAQMAAERALKNDDDPKLRSKIYRGPQLVATYGWLNGNVVRLANGTAQRHLDYRLEDGSRRLIASYPSLREAMKAGWESIRRPGSDKRRKVKLLDRSNKLIATWMHDGDKTVLEYAGDVL